jgi:hypothetical protein
LVLRQCSLPALAEGFTVAFRLAEHRRHFRLMIFDRDPALSS